MVKKTAAASDPNQPGNTLWVKLLIAGLLVSALGGFVRAQQSIQSWVWLQSLEVSPGPAYLAITGGLRGCIALAAAFGLWMKRGWAYRYTRIVVVVLILSSWLERLLFSRAEGAWTNLPFCILVSLAVLGYTLTVLRKHPRRNP